MINTQIRLPRMVHSLKKKNTQSLNLVYLSLFRSVTIKLEGFRGCKWKDYLQSST
jgi:hypothetical protein